MEQRIHARLVQFWLIALSISIPFLWVENLSQYIKCSAIAYLVLMTIRWALNPDLVRITIIASILAATNIGLAMSGASFGSVMVVELLLFPLSLAFITERRAEVIMFHVQFFLVDIWVEMLVGRLSRTKSKAP